MFRKLMVAAEVRMRIAKRQRSVGLGVMVVALAVMFLVTSTSRADFIWSGSGINGETGNTTSAQATFTVSGNTLTVVLQNTTSGGTLLLGDTLTGLEFNVSGTAPTLTLTSTSLTSGSNLFTDATTTNNGANLNGSWTNQLSGTASFQYGVATTGFNGEFQAGGITLGGGGPDYSIVAAGTDLTGLPGPQFPFIQDSLTFTFTISGGTLSESQISQVDALFGTGGDGRVHLQSIPEPNSLYLAGCGVFSLLGFVGYRRFRPSAA